jgi:bla regulator protein BlaR1
LLNWIMTGLQILHWFNPLVWFGFARWRVDREIACDAAALEAAGPSSNRAYGQTLLRLLQHLSPAARRPGLVGVLEDRNQLRRRMNMIARFTPARRPFVAAGLLAILAMVGLTDAQTTPRLAPSIAEAAPLAATPVSSPATVASPAANLPVGPSVLILVSRAETMLGDTEEEIAQWRTQPDNQKTSAPKWQRAQILLRIVQKYRWQSSA